MTQAKPHRIRLISSVDTNHAEPTDRARPRVRGYKLFETDENGRGKVVFIDINELTENTMLEIVVRNAVRSVIDIRPNTVFDKPRFRHKSIVGYLHLWNIPYIEYAMTVRNRHVEEKQISVDDQIEDALGRGLVLCLFDSESKKCGWISDLRTRLARMPNFLAEVNSRSLISI